MAERRRRRGGLSGRRGLRIAALALAGLFALLLALLWFAPRFTDWNRHRAALAAVVSAALGRPVTLAGPITLSLLPQTQLRAGAITVADIGDGVGITARAVRLRVALGPLLAGRVVMRTLFLDRPTVTLPWPLPPNGIAAMSPAWLSDLSARIENGTLVIGGLRLTGVNARLAAGGGAGALSASGTAKFAGRGWSFLLTLAEPGGTGQSALNLRVNEAARAGAAAPIGLGFGGTVSPEGEVRGRLVLQGGDLGALLPAPALPFDLRGTLAASARAVTMGKAAIVLGGVVGSGGLRLAIAPRLGLAVSLTLPRLALAPWLALWAAHPPAAAAVPARLAFAIGEAAVPGGVLAGLRGGLRWGVGGLTVTALGAGLPGGGLVSFAGAARAGPRGHGRVRLVTPALGATAAWLARALGAAWPALPPGLAGRAALSSRLRLAPGRVMFARIEGTLGASRVAGGVSLALGVRPHVAAGLRFDRLSLDPWRATARAARAALAGVGSRFGFDLQLRVGRLMVAGWRIDHLLLDAGSRGHEIVLRRASGAVGDIHGLAGATWTMPSPGPAVAAKPAPAGVLRKARLTLSAPDGTTLARILPALAARAPALWQGPFTLSATATGPVAGLTGRFAARLGDLRLGADAQVDLPAGRLRGPFTLRFPAAARLLAAFGVARPEAWVGPGSLSLRADAALGAGGLDVRSFALTAGTRQASGDLRLAWSGPGPVLTGNLDLDQVTLPAPGPAAALALRLPRPAGWPPAGLRAVLGLRVGSLSFWGRARFTDVAGSLATAPGRLDLALAGARFDGGRVAGTLGLDATAGLPRFALEARLSGVRVERPVLRAPLDLLAGTVSGRGSARAEGYSLAAIAATLAGRFAVTVANGRVRGFDLAALAAALAGPGQQALAAARRALAGGESAFGRLDLAGTLAEGTLRLGQGRLAGPSGQAVIAGAVGLLPPRFDLDLRLTPALAAAPTLGLAVGGPLADPQFVPDLGPAIAWRLAHPPH